MTHQQTQIEMYTYMGHWKAIQNYLHEVRLDRIKALSMAFSELGCTLEMCWAVGLILAAAGRALVT